MSKADKLKLTITVNNAPVYFGAPVFYTIRKDGDGDILVIQTEIGNQGKQQIEITLKEVTYVKPEPSESTT
jgi:hypothetical protein